MNTQTYDINEDEYLIADIETNKGGREENLYSRKSYLFTLYLEIVIQGMITITSYEK